ncbi:MAG: phospholipase D-like domain-containing protein [Caldilineaceae bacterium]
MSATTTVAVGPEGLYTALAALNSATSSLDAGVYTLEHPALTDVLRQALARGVQVRILLEGSPPGGISDEQRWCVAQLAAAGADVRYMAANDGAPRGYSTRYAYSHAKYLVLDGRVALVGTDNFNLDSVPMPADTPVGERRGAYLITDAAPVVAALQQIFDTTGSPIACVTSPCARPSPLRRPARRLRLPEPPVYRRRRALHRHDRHNRPAVHRHLAGERATPRPGPLRAH